VSRLMAVDFGAIPKPTVKVRMKEEFCFKQFTP
jgi:hypothetical protein